MPVIKVSEASGAVLDWMVGIAEGDNVFRLRVARPTMWKGVEAEPDAWEPRAEVPNVGWFADFTYNPSVNWAQGGPIIEREKIELIPPRDEDDPEWMAVWYKCEDAEAGIHVGTSPLLAAMRCYVASKLGDQVEVPDELV